MRNVLLFCHNKKPKHTQTHFIAKEKYSKVSRAWHKSFCELCWRKSQAEEELRNGAKHTNKSMRFCEKHDPRDKNSFYRRDHNKRNNLDSLLRELEKTGYYYNIFDESQVIHLRKLACRMLLLNITSSHLRVFDLLLEGYSQSEIVRDTGVSRQAISKLKNKHKHIMQSWFELKTSSDPIDPADLEIWEK